MNEALATIGASMAAAMLFVVTLISGTLFSALSGWIVGWLFPETTSYWLTMIGLEIELWQLSAMLGFILPYIRKVTK